jgi:hypothetical protein
VPDGVSALAALTAVISDFAWLAHGITAALPAVWGVSILALIPSVWAVLLLRDQFRRLDVLGGLAYLTVLLIAAAANLFAGALALGVVVTTGPQVWKALRGEDLRGISPATWCIALIDGSAWGTYGLVIGDMALQGYGIVMLVSAVVILVRLAQVRDSFQSQMRQPLTTPLRTKGSSTTNSSAASRVVNTAIDP